MYTHRGIELPEELREKIDAYVKYGRHAGDFLQAVINNDLKGAVARADEDNLKVIPAIVGYLYNECPTRCWGGPGAYAIWMNDHAIARQLAKEAR
jgi:hypothetical protein